MNIVNSLIELMICAMCYVCVFQRYSVYGAPFFIVVIRATMVIKIREKKTTRRHTNFM